MLKVIDLGSPKPYLPAGSKEATNPTDSALNAQKSRISLQSSQGLNMLKKLLRAHQGDG